MLNVATEECAIAPLANASATQGLLAKDVDEWRVPSRAVATVPVNLLKSSRLIQTNELLVIPPTRTQLGIKRKLLDASAILVGKDMTAAVECVPREMTHLQRLRAI